MRIIRALSVTLAMILSIELLTPVFSTSPTAHAGTNGPEIKWSQLDPPQGTVQIVAHRELRIPFDEPVQRGTGVIEIQDASGTVIESFDVATEKTRLQFDQSGTIVILKPQKLEGQTGELHVFIPSGAFYGVNSNKPYNAQTNPIWSFTLKQFTVKDIQYPKNGEKFVDADNPIRLHFELSEPPHHTGSGYIQIRRKDNNALIHSIRADNTEKVEIAGAQVTVHLDKVLDYGTEYYVEIEPNAFFDANNNPFSGITGKSFWTFHTEPAFDNAPPKATAYTPAIGGTLGQLNGFLTIQFDEPVYKAGGDIVIVRAADNKTFCTIPVQSSAVQLIDGGKTVKIAPSDYGCGNFENNAQYKVQIGSQAFRDGTGNYFAGVTNWTFTVRQDTAAPTIVSYSPAVSATGVSASTTTFSVTFNEPVRIAVDQATQKPKTDQTPPYLVRTSNPNSGQMRLSAQVDPGDTRKVILALTGSDKLSASTQYSILIPAGVIEDLAGNPFAGILGPYQWTFQTAGSGTTPVLNDARMDGAAIVLTYNVTLDSTKVPLPGNFYVTVNDEYRPVTSVSVSGNQVRLALASGVLVGQVVKVTYTPDLYSKDRRIQSVDGKEAAAFSGRTVTNTEDTTLPRPVSGTVSGNSIVLTFNRPLAALSTYAYQQFTVRWGGQTISVSNATTSGSNLVLTVGSYWSANDAVAVTYTPGAYPLRDTAGNYVNAFTDFYVTNPYDTQPPQLIEVTASGNKIVLTYNEGLNANSVPSKSSYSVVAGGKAVTISSVTVKGNTVELTLASSLAANEPVILTYVPASPYLTDLSGNRAPEVIGYQTTATGTGKARLVSATVNGTLLTLTYSSALSSSVTPLTSQYYVTADNAYVPVSGVTVSGTQVLLTLSTAVRSGQLVKVNYYTSGYALKDALNNTVDPLTGVTVTNQTSSTSVGLDYAELDAGKGLKLNSRAVTVSTGRTISGKSARKYQVDRSKLTGAFAAIRNGVTGGLPQVLFQVPESEPGAIVSLPASAVLDAVNLVANGEFTVEYGKYRFTLPLKAVGYSRMQGVLSGGLINGELVVKIEPASASQMQSAVYRRGAAVVGSPVDFAVFLVSGGTETEITEFDTYVTRAITIAGTNLKPEELVVVRYDPVSGEAVHVPTKIERDGSGLTFRFMRKGNSVYAVVRKTVTPFPDMQKHWARDDVAMLAAKFIVDGKTSQRYEPQQAVTRADFAKFIAQGLGLTGDRNEAAKYRDIAANDAYAPYIGAASKAGIVQGGTDGRFRPNDPITREEMATMMLRAISYTNSQVSQSTAALNKFADRGQISSWARSGVAACVNAGIIKGVTETRFAPKQNATRAEAAVMIKRLLEFVEFLES